MCGPADFGALHTCMTSLAELSAAGLTTYSLYATASLCRQLRAKRGKRNEKAARNLPGRLAAEGLSGQPNV